MYYQNNMFHCIKIASVELVNKKGEQINKQLRKGIK